MLIKRFCTKLCCVSSIIVVDVTSHVMRKSESSLKNDMINVFMQSKFICSTKRKAGHFVYRKFEVKGSC